MTQARPFLKWAGGKQRLVHKLAPLLPRSFRTYYEPFLGGGALFWHLGPRRAVLGDMNERLVRTYRAVQRDPAALAAALRKAFPAGRLPTEAEYLEVRDAEPDGGSDLEVAVWLLYVNRFGFNGLYRVNRAGRYNVAFGPPKRPVGVDEENLKACSVALRRAEIVHAPFFETAAGAGEGDFAYFDPPYDPIDSNPYGFISYTAEKFGPAHQRRLRDVALDLAGRGCAVAVSNALTPRVLGLYEGGSFFVVPLLAPRTLNRDVRGRGPVHEVVILTQPPRRQRPAPARSAEARTLPMFGAASPLAAKEAPMSGKHQDTPTPPPDVSTSGRSAGSRRARRPIPPCGALTYAAWALAFVAVLPVAALAAYDLLRKPAAGPGDGAEGAAR